MNKFPLNFQNKLKDRKDENVIFSEVTEKIHRKFEAALFEPEIVLKENQNKFQV
ncbi:hypothetical protein [Candidatus Williamhamiltonella defendens]|uniref:hypothetical protein n=1 Tax=Candidatus Williamhamiltonella defendens TaxID=138072 RepID=UPI001F334B44|nr:hypothetical protein [Candidatus Hamiltonella defensa]